MSRASDQKSNFLTKCSKNIPLSRHTTFGIGGSAKYFFKAKTQDELIEAVEYACQNKIPYYIIGNGSNLLVADDGFQGLIIKALQLYSLTALQPYKKNLLKVPAGVLLAALAQKTTALSLTGLEWAAGVPGTLGGAIYGNAGCFGKAIGGVIESVTVLKNENSENVKCQMSNVKCHFAYRSSIFKKHKNWIILSAVLKLKPGNKKDSIKLMRELVIKKYSRQPKGKSAGCIFKNLIVKKGSYEDKKIWQKLSPELKKNKFYIDKNTYKFPAWPLIDEAGMRGFKIGDAQVSEMHSNYILNKNQALSEQVVMLIAMMKQKVRREFGIQLNEEIEYLIV